MRRPEPAADSLRAECAGVVLSAASGMDAEVLGSLLPRDVELDPALVAPPGVPAAAARSWCLRESLCRADRELSSDGWALPLVARVGVEVVGLQWLEGVRWRTDRLVDSSSWVVPGRRWRGLGTAMRRAALGLAFEALDAAGAITSAWSDNAASLAVSRRVGYVETGRRPHSDRHRSGTLVELALPRAAWPPLRAGVADADAAVVVSAGERVRVSALALSGGAVLVMRRPKQGDEYATLIGGGVEDGESHEDAVLRELTEETGLSGRLALDLGWPAPGQHVYLVDTDGTEPVLCGPERAKADPWNRYRPEWYPLADLDALALRPAWAPGLVRDMGAFTGPMPR